MSCLRELPARLAHKCATDWVLLDRCSLFMVDEQHDELYSRVFDGGADSTNSGDESGEAPAEIRFAKNVGIAGYVASTGTVGECHEADHGPLTLQLGNMLASRTTLWLWLGPHTALAPSHPRLRAEIQTLNIPDAYKDERFNKEVDRKTGFRTTSVLCMPIFSPSGVRPTVHAKAMARLAPRSTGWLCLQAFSPARPPVPCRE